MVLTALTQGTTPNPLWENLANIGSLAAAAATLLLFVLAWLQIRILRQEIKQGHDAVTAARRSADASEATVRESARVRADDHAPCVIALVEVPRWPPRLDRNRRGMPSGSQPHLLSAHSLHQSEDVEYGRRFTFDIEKQWFMWFSVRGLLVNEGSYSARIRLARDAQLISGVSALAPDEELEPPPLLGRPDDHEYLLRPGEKALFERLGRITPDAVRAVEGLGVMRNLAVHGGESRLTSEQAQEYVFLAAAAQYALRSGSPPQSGGS